MASRSFKPIQTLGTRAVLLAFTIVPNGTSTPTIENDNDKAVASIARTGVGTYTITLRDTYARLVAWHFGVRLNSDVATTVQITGAPDVASARTIDITIQQESAGAFAAADIAANANNRIGVQLYLRDSTV